MDLQLKNRLALVSGSTAGIGYAIAEALLREGARVIVNGRTQAAVDAAVAKLGVGAIGFAGDLASAAGADALAKAHPDIDILVNNLGIFEPKAFEDIPDADWTRFFDVNVLSGVRLSRQVLPNNLWVRVHTDDGLIGLGETYYLPRAVAAVIHDVYAPLLLGRDPLGHGEQIGQAMHRCHLRAGIDQHAHLDDCAFCVHCQFSPCYCRCGQFSLHMAASILSPHTLQRKHPWPSKRSS